MIYPPDPYEHLWNYHFEREEDESENVNGEFEIELKNEEDYYERKYNSKE